MPDEKKPNTRHEFFGDPTEGDRTGKFVVTWKLFPEDEVGRSRGFRTLEEAERWIKEELPKRGKPIDVQIIERP